MKALKPELWSVVAITLLLRAPCAWSACAPPPEGLVAWWPGDGTTLSITGPAGAPFGVTYAQGEVGEAFAFDGNDHYVATELDAQPSAMPQTTWEAWVYPTRTRFPTRQQILSLDSGGYGRSVLIEANTSNFGVFTGQNVWQPTEATTNEWQHIAVVYAATNIYFYKNGVQFSLDQSAYPRPSTRTLQIGRNPGYGEYFQGLIDEVAVYNRALGQEEISVIFSAGSAGKCKNLGSVDLAIALQTSPAIAAVGENVTNTITAVNRGPRDAVGVQVTYPLPANAALVSSETTRGSWARAGSQLVCTLGTLQANQSAELRVIVKVTAPGSLTNHVTIESPSPDLLPEDNQATTVVAISRYYTPQDGDWDADYMTLYDTPEAGLMARTGDIDNLGFGWPAGFDPFSGKSTPGHAFPWTPPTNAPAGTDRIMVLSSYDGHPPRGADGYTGYTSRPGNAVQPVELNFDLGDLPVSSAALQLFVDDFQASNWGASYTVTLNGIRAPFLEMIINAMSQTGPVGKLVSANIPVEFLPLLRMKRLSILIDDVTTGAGDGFAIDFVKLLINVKAFGQVGMIRGTVRDSTSQLPIPGVRLEAGGYATTTDAAGQYQIEKIPAGLVFIEATHFDYARKVQSTDLQTGQTNTVDFALVMEPRLRIDLVNGQAVLSWPAALADFKLQATYSPSQPSQWLPEGSVPVVVSGRNMVTNPIDSAARFYRLAKP